MRIDTRRGGKRKDTTENQKISAAFLSLWRMPWRMPWLKTSLDWSQFDYMQVNYATLHSGRQNATLPPLLQHARQKNHWIECCSHVRSRTVSGRSKRTDERKTETKCSNPPVRPLQRDVFFFCVFLLIKKMHSKEQEKRHYKNYMNHRDGKSKQTSEKGTLIFAFFQTIEDTYSLSSANPLEFESTVRTRSIMENSSWRTCKAFDGTFPRTNPRRHLNADYIRWKFRRKTRNTARSRCSSPCLRLQ